MSEQPIPTVIGQVTVVAGAEVIKAADIEAAEAVSEEDES